MRHGLGWLAAPAAAPRLPDNVVRRHFPRSRLRAFLGIFIGSAGCYLIRDKVHRVASILIDEGRVSTVGVGHITNAALIAYGLSKFMSAIVFDRFNTRHFLPIGLARRLWRTRRSPSCLRCRRPWPPSRRSCSSTGWCKAWAGLRALGAPLTSSGIGVVVHHLRWDMTFVLLIAFAFVTVVLLVFVDLDEKAMMARRAVAHPQQRQKG